MGTNYILYYIVPLHTFYFLVVLTTMGVAQSLNYTVWGARFKIFVVAVIIYVVWELEKDVDGIFDVAFWPLKPLLTESNGSLVSRAASQQATELSRSRGALLCSTSGTFARFSTTTRRFLAWSLQ